MQSRYPGTRPFEANETALFFGRQRETKAFCDLIKSKRFAVLFSKVGIGKTSLLNAGVLPLLAQEGCSVLKVRFQHTAVSPTQTLLDAVKSHVAQQGLEAKVTETLRLFVGDRQASLWEYLKACSLAQNNLQCPPLLVFDQFDDFFSHNTEQQKDFIDGISDILLERVPEQARQTPQQQTAWATPLNWKIVFAIRLDSIGLLDDLHAVIPNILDNRYQLHPLHKTQAREAIVAPAALEGNDFSTPPFTYQGDTLDKMLQSLCNEKEEVEPASLQSLCQHVEQQVATRKTAAPIVVSLDYLARATQAENTNSSSPDKTGWHIAPISQRMKSMFFLSISIMFLHKVECWLTDEWVESPFFLWLVSFALSLDTNTNAAIGEIIFFVFVFWLFAGLIMGWMLMRGGISTFIALAVWGLTFALEWHHPFRSISLQGYYPGLITALIYLPVMFFYWIVLLKHIKRPSIKEAV